jgi:hypothetical protein
VSDSPQRNKIVNLGLLLAAGHFALFLLSAQLAQQGQGWAGVFVWPVWLLIDFPVSLLHFLMHQRRIDLWVQAMSSGSIVWAYLLYSPYLVHGIIGTIWWGFLPKLFYQYRSSRTNR